LPGGNADNGRLWRVNTGAQKERAAAAHKKKRKRFEKPVTVAVRDVILLFVAGTKHSGGEAN
jgi:hypothetical protein